jgi:hypothetical protein
LALIDAYNTSGGGTGYRLNDAGDLGNEVTGDVLREQYTTASTNDYDIGWTAASQWANYTRTYPTGVFNVIMRGSSPSGQEDAARLMLVTSGEGTSNQTTTVLGQFNVPQTGGWQVYTMVPMVDTNGNPAAITNSGKVQTFKLYEDNGGWNANFLMLVPVSPVSPLSKGPQLSVAIKAGQVIISFSTTTGASYQIQYKNNLTDSSWTALGNPISGTGGVASVQDAVVAGSYRFYRAVVTQ